jgi:hypothetical protein
MHEGNMSIDDNNVPTTATHSLPTIDLPSKANKTRNWGVIFVGVTCGVILSFFICSIAGVAAWNSIDSAHQAATISAANLTDPNLVVGVWDCPGIIGGLMEIKRNYWGEEYIAVLASDESTTTNKGEVILQFSFNLENLQFEGRHLWGGGKSDTTEWGEDGGVIMELRDADTLFVRFVYSVYTDGWVYTRVK